MLAYTTVSDFLYLPTGLETAVYIGGLIFVLACPYIVLGLVDMSRNAAQKRQTPTDR